MKRIAIPVDTEEKCHYGCGNIAKFKNGSGNLMCLERCTQCPAIKEKNSIGGKLVYKDGLRPTARQQYDSLPQDKKDAMNSNKGKRYADFSYGGKGDHKNALLSERGHQCESCNLEDWLGLKITLELEHVDGDRQNNTKENLKLLCPNCHSQTPTWRRGKNPGWKKQKYTDEQILEAVESSSCINQVLTKLDLRYGSVKTIIDVMFRYKVNFRE